MYSGQQMAVEAGQASDADALLKRAAIGDREAWGALLSLHRDRLVRMIAVRLDDRLRGRIDASDVIQEAYLEASQRLKEYVDRPEVPFFIWLRALTGQRLAILHRHHLGTRMRAAALEVPLQGATPETSSAALANCLAGDDTRPSEAAVKAETRQRYEIALNSLDPMDREVLALRHYEQLTNVEAAQALGIEESAASKRYIRAVARLRDALDDIAESRP